MDVPPRCQISPTQGFRPASFLTDVPPLTPLTDPFTLEPTSMCSLHIRRVVARLEWLPHLGDVGFDALGQLHAGLPQELGQLVGNVGILVQGVQQTQTLQLLGDALATHLHTNTQKHR